MVLGGFDSCIKKVQNVMKLPYLIKGNYYNVAFRGSIKTPQNQDHF